MLLLPEENGRIFSDALEDRNNGKMNNYCIISHKYRFVYIPIPKVACTSLLNRVAEIIHGKDVQTILNSSHRDVHTKREKIFNTQESEICRNTVEALKNYSEYFKFVFVRNPFDRVHSCYVDKISMNTYGFDNNLITKYPQMYRGMPFSEFLKCIRLMPLGEMDEHFRPQYSFFDKNHVDYIGKLETIEEDWTKIENIIGVSHKPLNIYNKTQEVDYYDIESENLVLEIYGEDFEKFSYDKKRVKKKPKDRYLPIIITAESDDKIYPFKNVFVERVDDKLVATVTGSDSIIIIPYFNLREGKRIVFEIDVFSDIESVLTIFYTDKKNWDKPHFKSKSASLRRGENHITINIDDEDSIGRLRLQISEKPGKLWIKRICINERTLPWLEDPADMTDTNQNIFSLPWYVQKHKNLSSMCNYASLYIPILEALNPKHICEIGCERGENTRVLINFCKKNAVKLTIVDPSPIDPELTTNGDPVLHVRKKSLAFLGEPGSRADVYFIDGDHNYETVSEELAKINKLSAQGESPVCIFLHDLSWPWAYRDLYYSPEELGVPNSTYVRDKGVSLYSNKPVEDGLPTLGKYAFRVNEGGDRNGVLKAVEDFLSANSNWEFVKITSIYGLGILWTHDKLSEAQKETFSKIKEHFLFFQEFLSILEWNRLALYLRINKNAKTWRKDQEYIKELQSVISSSISLKDQFKNIIKKLKFKK